MATTETPSANDEQRTGWRIKPSRALVILAGVSVVGTLIFWWLGSLPDDPDVAIPRYEENPWDSHIAQGHSCVLGLST